MPNTRVNPAQSPIQLSVHRAPSPPLNPSPNIANQLEKHLYLVSYPDMANVEAFKAFLKERQTGLQQKSEAWVKARQHTIGASEISALTGASPFETPASLVHKKLHPPDLSKNVACAWGKLFEPFVRAYFAWEHHTQVFGHTISLNLAKDHPLYGKVACSPDGYFQALDGSIVLLEFKCPFKRKIAVHKTPTYYRDQIQTGLALSGESVTKRLFVDACFRMCSLSQFGMNLAHNAVLHGGVIHKTKTPFPRAWGICILESKQKITPNQASLLNLGTTTSQAMFTRVMLGHSSGVIQTYYNRVRVVLDPRAKAEELQVLKAAKDQFRYDPWRFGGWHPVAFFAWKLLDITEIVEPKNPTYLQSIEAAVTSFHWLLELEKARQAGDFQIVPNNLVNDMDVLEAFLQGQ